MPLTLDEKKQKVLDVLVVLGENDIWDLAKPLAIFIVNSKSITIELLDAVLEIVSKSIEKTTDKVKLAKLEKAKIELEKIKVSESKEREKDMLDAENIILNI